MSGNFDYYLYYNNHDSVVLLYIIIIIHRITKSFILMINTIVVRIDYTSNVELLITLRKYSCRMLFFYPLTSIVYIANKSECEL